MIFAISFISQLGCFLYYITIPRVKQAATYMIDTRYQSIALKLAKMIFGQIFDLTAGVYYILYYYVIK